MTQGTGQSSYEVLKASGGAHLEAAAITTGAEESYVGRYGQNWLLSNTAHVHHRFRPRANSKNASANFLIRQYFFFVFRALSKSDPRQI